MSSSGRAFDSIPGGTRRSYIATRVFDSYFYSYNNGVWGDVTNNSSLCPPGRILRETGKKLYPGANPNVDAFYVGVYDPVTFLNGFIDPNDAVFALFNDDKPTYIADNSDDPAFGPNVGAPVYTNGAVQCLGPRSESEDFIPATFAGMVAGFPLALFQMYSAIDDGGYIAMYTGPHGYESGLGPADIEYGGYLHPVDTCGVATLVSGVSGAINLPEGLTNADAVVLLSRKTFSGAAGTPTWAITGINPPQLTITSYLPATGALVSTDNGTIGWFVVTNSSFGFGPFLAPAPAVADAPADAPAAPVAPVDAAALAEKKAKSRSLPLLPEKLKKKPTE